MNLLQQVEKKYVEKLTKDQKIPDFRPGDTIRVHVKVIEGDRERTQPYEGVCIGRKNKGLNSSFRVRKLSYGEGVERVFPLYSPNIRIELVRHGDVRRAKLYYLRGRTGKSARIAEKARTLLASNDVIETMETDMIETVANTAEVVENQSEAKSKVATAKEAGAETAEATKSKKKAEKVEESQD